MGKLFAFSDELKAETRDMTLGEYKSSSQSNNDTLQDWKTIGKYEDYHYLVNRLDKECATGRKGHEGMGVECDAPVSDFKNDFSKGKLEEGDTLIERLFNNILFEIDNIAYTGHEYTYEYIEEDYWFTNERQVQTYIRRLKRFCKKYAPKYLDARFDQRMLDEIDRL